MGRLRGWLKAREPQGRLVMRCGDAQVSCHGTGLSEPTAQLQAECVNRFAEQCKKIYKN